MKLTTFATVSLSVVSLWACNETPPKTHKAPAPAAATGSATTPQKSGELPPGHPPIGPQAGASAKVGAMATTPTVAVAGTVKETLDASMYTYVRLDQDGKEVWAAVPQAKIAVGSKVSVVNAVLMKNFHSKTHNRDFAEVWFGTLGGQAEAVPAADLSAFSKPIGEDTETPAADNKKPTPGEVKAAVAEAHGAATVKAEPVKVVEPVAPATGENATTVAKVYADRATLGGKPVRIRGKVVKLNTGIMGRNWIHLEDGTGTPEKGDNDLLFTTDAAPAVGSVVVLSGTVALDKDFGSGYKYSVMVEKASVEAAK